LVKGSAGREGFAMAKRTKFGGKPQSKVDRSNPFWDVMSPSERKWAAGNIKRAGKGGKKGGKSRGGAGGGS
jgi:hypothetical protein